jgi:hypothetical protein
MMSSRVFSAALGAVFIIGLGSISVSADGLTSRFQAIAKACDADVQSFCKGLPPGGGRILRCLGANYMSVSSYCRNTMASAMNDICGQDLARLCPGSTLGSGEAESCLQSHMAELKGSCKTAADRLAAK